MAIRLRLWSIGLVALSLGCGGGGGSESSPVADGLLYGSGTIELNGETLPSDFLVLTENGRIENGYSVHFRQNYDWLQANISVSNEAESTFAVEFQGGIVSTEPGSFSAEDGRYRLSIGDGDGPRLNVTLRTQSYFAPFSSGTSLPAGWYTGVYAAFGPNGERLDLGRAFAESRTDSILVDGEVVFQGNRPRADGTFESGYAAVKGTAFGREAEGYVRREGDRYVVKFPYVMFENSTVYAILKPADAPR